MLKMKSLLCIGVICWCVLMSRSAKVIVVMQNVNSHIIYHAKVARLLAEEHHSVDITIPSCARIPDSIQNSSVQIVRLKMNCASCAANEKKISQLYFDYAMTKTFYEALVVHGEMVQHTEAGWSEMCTALLTDVGVREHINSSQYDVAIVDAMALNCFLSLVPDRRMPIVVYGVNSIEWALRLPSLPSFIPSQFSQLDDEMSFWQRLLNTLWYVVTYAAFSATNSHMVPMKAISENSSMYFLLSDVSIDYPRPSMPNVISVGDAIPEPGQALPSDIAEFVESADHGVTLVSFGSYLDYFPRELTEKFCTAFKMIPQKVIWKLKDKSLCDPEPNKVLLLDWLPQNDLLSHRNVKLFISHCGVNSILESIYHCTPILGFPIAIDQPYNVRRLKGRGLGYEMKLNDFTVEDLVSNISAILSDETILSNVKRASFLLRNKPDTPAKRISYWVQHLATYGDKHLKTRAFELNIFQFCCLDVILAIFVTVFLITFLVLKFLRFIFHFVFRCRSSRKKKTD